jgi:hypothetical protein
MLFLREATLGACGDGVYPEVMMWVVDRDA